MNSIDIKLEKVLERDIDLLLINNFVNYNLLELFLNKINLTEYHVVSIQHSYIDRNGESDITVIASNGKGKIGLLIEDKIDAPAMPNQAKRYEQRAKDLKEKESLKSTYIFIVAPKKYLDNNEEAKKYPNKVTYEEILSFVKDEYSLAILKYAIDESKKGYVVNPDNNVSSFWKELLKTIDNNERYHVLKVRKQSEEKGSYSYWPTFSLGVSNVNIIYKSIQGSVQIVFSKVNDKFNQLRQELLNAGIHDYMIKRANTEAHIELSVPTVDFRLPFESCNDQVLFALDKAVELYNLFHNKSLYEIYKKVLSY